jgi:coenzyme F420-reducing hydrogenase alpha subunit
VTGKSIRIENAHISRVEGHGNIVVYMEGDHLLRVEWQIPEAPRFFEAMVVGRDWSELSRITSRICGICSIGHTFASQKATEAAMEITITEQTRRLREILNHAENLQSHILHVCYLVLPDLLGVGSVLPLMETHRDVVLLAIRLHRLANETCDKIGGRTTHPIRSCVNGWSMLPDKKTLREIRDNHVKAMDDLKHLAEFVQSLTHKLPDFERETEYVSLTHPKEYALYDGVIKSSDVPDPISPRDYERVTNEYVDDRSTAKWTRFNRGAYAVGALARFNNNTDQLSDGAKAAAGQLGLSAPCHKPFMNSVAQVVECVLSVEKTIAHSQWFLDNGIKEEDTGFSVREGRGVGAVDVPRGTLFHDYTYDGKGKCVEANLVIPTNQNHANIQADMEELVPLIKDMSTEKINLTLEMLVRAYDPCISCSTHLVDLRRS